MTWVPDLRYEEKMCLVGGCPTRLVNLPGVPDVCPYHDFTPQIHEGQLVQVGEEEEWVAADGKDFGPVVRFVKRIKPIYKREKIETWLDKDTGQKMGRRTLV